MITIKHNYFDIDSPYILIESNIKKHILKSHYIYTQILMRITLHHNV